MKDSSCKPLAASLETMLLGIAKKENVTNEQYQMYQIMMQRDKLDVGPTTDVEPSVLQIRQKLDELSI